MDYEQMRKEIEELQNKELKQILLIQLEKLIAENNEYFKQRGA